MRSVLFAIATMAAVSPAVSAPNCVSVGGQQASGNPVEGLQREIRVIGRRLSISKFDQAGAYLLSCEALAKGVYCDTKLSDGVLTVMTNGDRALEALTDANGREIMKVSYQCAAGSLR